jgi:hypothetical protein
MFMDGRRSLLRIARDLMGKKLSPKNTESIVQLSFITKVSRLFWHCRSFH